MPSENDSSVKDADRRAEPRLRYSWQMYLEHPDSGITEEGRMIDLSQSGAAFITNTDSELWLGKRVDLRLTHPMLDEDRFSILEVRQPAEVIRIDPYGGMHKRVAVRLDKPLQYDPVGCAEGVRPMASTM